MQIRKVTDVGQEVVRKISFLDKYNLWKFNAIQYIVFFTSLRVIESKLRVAATDVIRGWWLPQEKQVLALSLQP